MGITTKKTMFEQCFDKNSCILDVHAYSGTLFIVMLRQQFTSFLKDPLIDPSIKAAPTVPTHSTLCTYSSYAPRKIFRNPGNSLPSLEIRDSQMLPAYLA
jgi:hypothetical protein